MAAVGTIECRGCGRRDRAPARRDRGIEASARGPQSGLPPQRKKEEEVMAEHSPLEDFLAGIGQRFKNAQAEHSRRLKGKSLHEIFENSIGAGFAGAGAIKAVRGLSSRIGILLGGKQVTKSGLRKIDKGSILSKEKSNLNRSSTISEEGLRKNVGGKRPPDAELEALALRKQEAAKIAKTIKKARKERLLFQTELAEKSQSSLNRFLKKMQDIVDEAKLKDPD